MLHWLTSTSERT